jgi:hypothetical protein
MREAKVALDVVFAKAGLALSDKFPEANPEDVLAWLKRQVSQLVPLLDNILDFGTYGATLSVARSFQAAGYDHLKRLGHINHTFPSVEDVQGVVEDRSCKNLCARFLKKFWMEGGGRALAFGEAACRVPQLGVPKLGPKPTTNQAPDQPFKGKKSTEEDP